MCYFPDKCGECLRTSPPTVPTCTRIGVAILVIQARRHCVTQQHLTRFALTICTKRSITWVTCMNQGLWKQLEVERVFISSMKSVSIVALILLYMYTLPTFSYKIKMVMDPNFNTRLEYTEHVLEVRRSSRWVAQVPANRFQTIAGSLLRRCHSRVERVRRKFEGSLSEVVFPSGTCSNLVGLL